MRNAELRSFLREAHSRCPELTILENEPMSRHCSFRIGGPCDAMLLPGDSRKAQAKNVSTDDGDVRTRASSSALHRNGTSQSFPTEMRLL